MSEHGTVFVGSSAEQWRLAEMLRRMAGAADGVRDAITRHLTPFRGPAPPSRRSRPWPGSRWEDGEG